MELLGREHDLDSALRGMRPGLSHSHHNHDNHNNHNNHSLNHNHTTTTTTTTTTKPPNHRVAAGCDGAARRHRPRAGSCSRCPGAAGEGRGGRCPVDSVLPYEAWLVPAERISERIANAGAGVPLHTLFPHERVQTSLLVKFVHFPLGLLLNVFLRGLRTLWWMPPWVSTFPNNEHSHVLLKLVHFQLVILWNMFLRGLCTQ